MRTEEEESKAVVSIAKEIRLTVVENLQNPSLELSAKKKAIILGIVDRTIYRYLTEFKENA